MRVSGAIDCEGLKLCRRTGVFAVRLTGEKVSPLWCQDHNMCAKSVIGLPVTILPHISNFSFAFRGFSVP